MINIDEQALICDLAEVYHIYDYKSLPIKLVATFSVGLRDDSRIKMKMNREKAPMKTIMLAMIADILSMMFWSIAGAESHGKPPLFTEMISEVKKSRYQIFHPSTHRKVLKRPDKKF